MRPLMTTYFKIKYKFYLSHAERQNPSFIWACVGVSNILFIVYALFPFLEIGTAADVENGMGSVQYSQLCE